MNSKTIYFLLAFLAVISVPAVLILNRTSPENTEPAKIVSPNKLVYSDEQFILGMVPHHQEAIDSSIELLAIATDPDVRAVAQDIITAQKDEVGSMKEWYTQWYQKDYRDDGQYKLMMRSPQGLTARQAEAEYVSDMIGHHEHAVLMAQDLLSFSNRPELRLLSENVIATQTTEILSLKTMLAEKFGQTPAVIDHSQH
jgi:uncharacterized protein (DUF305 family)